jgi:hypothetical protein
MITKLIISGSGGAACEALWVCRRMNEAGGGSPIEIVGFADDDPERLAKPFEGLPVLGTTAQVAEQFRGKNLYFHCAIGNNRSRQRVSVALEGRD